jgi:hypothetical protein
VVHADAAAHELGQRLAEAGGEAEGADRLGDRVALLAGDELRREQRLRALHRRGLGEVHDVDRRLVGADELLEQLVQRLDRPRERQRDRALRVVDQRGLAAGPARQVRRDLVTSPSVADMSRNCAWGRQSSGTCHAQPRWPSA